ncbi:MAG: helix-turn-helix domain-containing protein [Planctomycetota bacterium]
MLIICPINENSVGGRLRIFQKAQCYTIVKFAKILEISHGSLSDIENNKTKPSSTPISNLVQYTDINIYWLFAGEGEMFRKEGLEEPESPVDTNLLEGIIKWLDRYLAKNRKTLPPAKKASFIAFAYQYFTDTGKEADDKTMLKYLRLVA